MTKKTFPIHAIAEIKWKGKDKIGKTMPPPGTEKFAATARFAEDDELKLFSVVLLYSLVPAFEEAPQEVKLHFFAPELVIPRLRIGSTLFITDGIKVIAEAQVNSIDGCINKLSGKI